MTHKHIWARLDGYSKYEWRCTSALYLAQMVSPSFDDQGCLGTLAYWPERKLYSFSSPGTHVVELDAVPQEMILDTDYLAKLAVFAESMRTLAAA